MTKCQYCGSEVPLPFKCPYCNRYFCVEHRLPENHACPESWRARVPRPETPPVITERRPRGVPYEVSTPYRPRPKPRLFWFGPSEVKHLALASFLVMGVGLSTILQVIRLRIVGLMILAILAAIFTSVFLLHELAHKLTAQHYGLWAEFRLSLFGALITLLSIVSPIKLISPGAVMIVGPMSKEVGGKTSLAGPLTNIVLSILFLIFAYLSPFAKIVPMLGAAFSAWIALFNLIPFGVLDGSKVFGWNKTAWVTVFITSVALTIFTFNELGLF